MFYQSGLITEADGQHAFPSVTAQKTASFSLSFRPQTHISVIIALHNSETSKDPSARMRPWNIRELRLLEVCPWPTREPIQRLPSAQFNPLLEQLFTRHSR
jgi:hypothetical protein